MEGIQGMHYSFQCQSLVAYDPPNSSTWFHLLRQQAILPPPPLWFAETHWYANTQPRALSRLVTSA